MISKELKHTMALLIMYILGPSLTTVLYHHTLSLTWNIVIPQIGHELA